MRILITGAGEVGFYVASALCGENDITIIDKDSNACARLEGMDVIAVLGNGANARLLNQVGIKNTDIVLALTGNDEVNLISCITANKMGVKKTIARVSNPEYIDQPVDSRKQIGITHMLCPELLMAEEISRSSLYFPSMIMNRQLDGGKGELIEIKVGKDMPILGPVKDIALPDNCKIMAIKRNGKLMRLKDNTSVENEDHLIMICERGKIVELRGFLHENVASNNIMIVGGGVVGFYLAKRLGKMDFELKLVEIDKQRCQEIAEDLPDTLILNGDGADISLLKEENVKDMDVVFSVTGVDEKNLLCSLLAKQLGAKKIVTRVNKRDYIELFEMVGCDRAVSPGKVTVDAVLSLVAGGEDLVTLGDDRAEIVEFVARKNSEVVGRAIGKKIPKSAIVSMILRNGIPIVPEEGSKIEENDHVFVFTLSSEFSRVKKLFSAL